MDSGEIALFTSILFAIGGAAWFWVVRWTLLRKMEALEKEAADVMALETRLESLEKRPEPGVEEYKKTLMRLEEQDSKIRKAERDIEISEETLRRLINKMNGRQRKDSHENTEKEPRTDTVITLEDLKAAGAAVPLDEPEPEPAPARKRREDFGAIPINVGG